MTYVPTIPLVPPPRPSGCHLAASMPLCREEPSEIESRKLRAMAAIRVEIAAQDEAVGDCGARDRNLRVAAEYERLAAMGWRRNLGGGRARHA